MAAGIPLAPTHPADPYAGMIQSMNRDYPLIANIPFSVSRGQGPYESEVYMPWNKEQNPTPGQFHIELRHYLDQPRSQDDIRRLLTGEMFHYLGNQNPAGHPVNPQWYGLKQQVLETMPPHDMANAYRNWQAEQAVPANEKRSFSEFLQHSYIDQYIGGTMFPLSNEQEWVQRSRDLPRAAPQQAKVIDQMRQLLTTGKLPMDPIYARNVQYAKPGPWITQLAPNEESQFRQWAEKNRHQLSMEDMLNRGYDMRGFWKALQAGDPRARSGINEVDKLIHYPDIWKTPYHESFNPQSMYSLPTNPYHWVGDMQDPALVGANRQVVIPRKSGKPVDWNYRGPQ